MYSLQGIEKCKSPKTNKRKRMTIDRLLQDKWYEVVHHTPSERRYEKTDKIMNEETSDCRACHARCKELWQIITHDIDKTGPNKCCCEIPERYVERFFFCPKNRDIKV